MAIAITKEELKFLIADGVKEAFKTEMMKLRSLVLPSVSSQEQKEIEKLYDKPSI